MILGSVTLLKPLNVRLLPFAFSLASNYLTNKGKDMSGVKALAAALNDSHISTLKLVASPPSVTRYPNQHLCEHTHTLLDGQP